MPKHIEDLRTLAADGRLASVARTALQPARRELAGAAFSVAWPVVFGRLTRNLERRRGHLRCASSVFRMAEDCLDHFYDDVEAVIDDMLTHARTPIRCLEPWIASRLTAATVNGHRRRRGQRGALQRPRMPGWLSELLRRDPWLSDLATQMLVWVGVPATAGAELWPVEIWATRRTDVTGDDVRGDPALVRRDVDTVLAAMRTRPTWYQRYVERPLGHKRPPLVGLQDTTDTPALIANDLAESHLVDLAADAIDAIEARLRSGQRARDAVIEVIETVFGVDAGSDLALLPFHTTNYDQHVSAALRDPHQVKRIVATAMRIIAELDSPPE